MWPNGKSSISEKASLQIKKTDIETDWTLSLTSRNKNVPNFIMDCEMDEILHNAVVLFF